MDIKDIRILLDNYEENEKAIGRLNNALSSLHGKSFFQEIIVDVGIAVKVDPVNLRKTLRRQISIHETKMNRLESELCAFKGFTK